jgi:HSP20 family protein
MCDERRLDRGEFDDVSNVERGKNVAGRVANEFGRTMDDILVNLKSFQKDFDSKISEYKGTVTGKIDLDLIDAGDIFYVKANLPGINKDEINVEIVDKKLTITTFFGGKCYGEENCENTSCEFLIKGRTYGPAKKTIHLPAKIKINNTKAEFSNGILLLKLPKVEVKKLKVNIK